MVGRDDDDCMDDSFLFLTFHSSRSCRPHSGAIGEETMDEQMEGDGGIREDASSQGGRRRRHRRRNRPPGAPPILHQICRKLNASGPTFVCNANRDLSTSVECLAYLDS